MKLYKVEVYLTEDIGLDKIEFITDIERLLERSYGVSNIKAEGTRELEWDEFEDSVANKINCTVEELEEFLKENIEQIVKGEK